MFRIDRTLVNIAGVQDVQANIDASITEDVEHEAASGLKSDEEQLSRLKIMAAEIIDDATAEAAMRINKAEADAEGVLLEARQRGYLEGKANAEEEYQEYSQRQEETLRGLIEQIEQERDKMLAELEDEILGLCISIVKKVLDDENVKDDIIFNSIIKKALKRMKLEGKITVHVSRAEYERVFSSGSASFVLGDERISVSVIEDADMIEGDCIVESENEMINAGLGSQLKNIEQALRQESDSIA